jgi:hypothetical protein
MLPSELLGMCNDTADAPSRRMRSHALYPLRMLAVVFCGDPETFWVLLSSRNVGNVRDLRRSMLQ